MVTRRTVEPVLNTGETRNLRETRNSVGGHSDLQEAFVEVKVFVESEILMSHYNQISLKILQTWNCEPLLSHKLPCRQHSDKQLV